MRDITFTYYESNKDTKSQVFTRPWADWVAVLTNHDIKGAPEDTSDKDVLNRNKAGPALVFGFVDGSRKNKNVKEINALSLDLDESTEQEIIAILDTLSKYEYVAYSTHKHRAQACGGLPRIRIVLPLSEPISPKKFRNAWKSLDKLIGNANDGQTKDPARLNYLPSTFDLDLAWSQYNEGEWLTYEELESLVKSELDSAFSRSSLNSDIAEARSVLRKVKKEDDLKHASECLLGGTAYAEPGNIHETTLGITLLLAKKKPALSAEALKELFRESLTVMDMDLEKEYYEIIRAFKGAVEKIKELVQGEVSGGPYSDEQLRRIADAQSCSLDDLDHRWVVQKEGGGWVLDQKGHYAGYYSYKDFTNAIRKYLARAPIDLYTLGANGQYKKKSNEDIVYQYGDICSKVVSDMSAQYTKFDPETNIIYEAACPIRKLTPKYDPQIDKWLELLFEDKYEKSKDWMATAPDLTKQLCAIYFCGRRDSGKSIFAEGMAKLWTTGGPADIAHVLSNYNEEICRCPLVLADEHMPKKFSNDSLTPKLRSMLSATSRTLRRLYQPPSELEGAIRLVLAANNESLLFSNEVLTGDDLEAIAQRFLFVELSEDAHEYLKSFPRETTGAWINEGIARHALWLAENHEVKSPGKRFIVEGNISAMHRLLLVGAPWSSLVCEWLVRYLLQPKPFDSECTGLIQRKDGKLYVSNQAIVAHWDMYLGKTGERPDTRKIGTAIDTLAVDKGRKQLRWEKKRMWYKEIDVDHLLYWADKYNIGDEESLRETLGLPVSDEAVGLDNVTPMHRGGMEY